MDDAAGGDPSLAALWSPLQVAGVTLPNRVMTTALTLQYAVGGSVSSRHVAFYRERARGGVGLIVSEQLTASPSSESPFANALRAYDPGEAARFAAIVEALEPFGTKFFAQLFSAGAAGSSTLGLDGWSPLRGPSPTAAPGGETPLALTQQGLEQIASHYAQSARLLRQAGVQGVELHGAHGWLIGQFLSPLYNRRADEYGGTLENRCRLLIEIGTAVRAAVGPGCPLGVALTYDELMGSRGITPEDTLGQLKVLDATRLFDFFDLSVGSTHQQHHTLASMSVPEGFSLPFAAKAKAVVGSGTAILTAGRIVDPHMAARAIADGHADVIGMARAHLADPHLLRKARSGQRREITRCVGANHCVGRALSDQPVTCVLNPSTGREHLWNTRVNSGPRRRIAVIGAGPAGLRFGMSAARAGHSVTVYERTSSAGGHLAVLALLPTRQRWLAAVEDMTYSLHAAGGQLVLGCDVTAEHVFPEVPDLIVVATGSVWTADVVPDDSTNTALASTVKIMPLEQAIERAARGPVAACGAHAMIVDASGTYAPLGLADLLSAAAVRVTFVTPNERVGAVASLELELPHVMPGLLGRGVQIMQACDVERLDGRTVLLKSIWGGQLHAVSNVDSLVLARSRAPANELFTQLRARHPQVYCIGDAVSPRATAAVIHEAEAFARSL